MRKFIVIFITAVAVASCVRDNRGMDESEPVEIKLRAGAAATRAIVGPNGDTEFTPTIMGWEAPKGEADYTSQGTWSTVPSQPIPHNAANHTVGLLAPQYYNEDRTVYTHIKSWYPQGETVAGGIVSFTSPSTDGTQDVLFATEVSGAKFDPVGSPLTYRHPLIQVKVRVIKENRYPGQLMLKGIVLKNGALPVGIDLATDRVVYGVPTDVRVAGDEGQEVTFTSEYAGVPVMVEPFDGTELAFDVETDEAMHPGVTATITDEGFVPGKAYTITLTFSTEEVEAKASIAKWEAGTPGGTGID